MSQQSHQGDIMEKLFELGVSGTKSAGKKVLKGVKDQTQEFGKAAFEGITGTELPINTSNERSSGQNFTTLDFSKLDKTYRERDSGKQEEIETMLKRLDDKKEGKPVSLEKAEKHRKLKEFKQEEEAYYLKRKREERERKELEEYEEAQKKKHEEEKAQAPAELPRGKIRRSIFSRVKLKKSQPELRAGQGKS